MIASVTFENATIADVLKKAEVCAPKLAATGEFVSNAGIMMRLRPPGTTVQVSATNGEVFYDEWAEAVDIAGEPRDWRLPVARLTGILAGLPIGHGRTVTLTENTPNVLRLESRSTKAEARLISPEGYPRWEPYVEESMATVPGLGALINRVAWACAKDLEPFSGILFTGTHLLATNRLVAAMVPCSVPVISSPVTVPVKMLAPVLRHAGDVLVGATDTALTITPDQRTQIRCTTFATSIPTPKFIAQPYDSAVSISKELLVETVQRMMSITKGNKDREALPILKMILGGGKMALRVEGSEDGEWIQDLIELEGQAGHFPITLMFAPKTFLEAVNRAPDDRVLFCYNAEQGASNQIVRLDAGDGYMGWFVQWNSESKLKGVGQ